MKRSLLILLLAASLSFTACNGKDAAKKDASTDASGFKDGEYHGESAVDEWGGKVTTDIVIKDGKITEATLHNLTADGKEKGEDYGKAAEGATNKGLYKIAQNAIKQAQEYPKLLVETNDIEKVDAISGATTSFNSFKEAVNDALKNAKN